MQKLRSILLVLVALVFPAIAWAQSQTVSGTVTDPGGQPLAGAVVQIPSLRKTATTNDRGQYAFQNVPAGTHAVRVSLIGYRDAAKDVTVSGSPVAASFSLSLDPLRLDEVVAVGYGETKRRNLAGAVSSLKPSAVKEVPAQQVGELLHGRTPGVQVTQNSGTPGGALTVRVRGSSSINGGNDPLWVIDGVPMIQGNPNIARLGGFGGQGIDATGDLNPNEIESIEILKDASAAAIYGSRASNGVVLVTTKKGKAGKAEINFGAYYGNQSAWRVVPLLNADQYIEVYNEGCMNRYGAKCVTYKDEANAGAPIPSSVASAMKAYRGANTNWVSQVLHDAPIQNMEVSVRGGTDNVRYYVSGNSLKDDGMQYDLGYNKLNGRVNLDYQPSSRLTLGTNVALARAVTRRGQNDNTIQGGLANAIAIAPTLPVKDSLGKFTTGLYTNPVGNIQNRSAQERSVRVISNVFGQFGLTSWLNARAAANVDYYNLRGLQYNSPAYGSAAGTNGFGRDASEYDSKVVYEGTLNFSRPLMANQEISGVVGASYEKNVEQGSTVSGQDFPNELFKYLSSAATITGGTSRRDDWGLQSVFGRFTHVWRDRVTTSFNVRRDGSSRFGALHRYGTFPSLAVNWRVGEESFMQNQGIIAGLLLRASYGVTGNQQGLGNFQSRALFQGGSNYMDQSGISPQQLANSDLRWEKTKQSNFGADFSVINNRLKVSADYYVKHTDDLLYSRPIPSTTGFTSITTNVGAMENKGIDLGLTADWITSKKADGFNFSSTLSLSRNRNKVLELYNGQNSLGANALIVGQPLGVFYGYTMEGIFQDASKICKDTTGVSCLANGLHAVQVVNATNPALSTAPGDVMFKDTNGRGADGKLTGQPDGKINSDDQTVIGSPWPDYEGGLNNSISWKSFDLSAFIQFTQGNKIYNGLRLYMDRYGSDGDNHSTRALSRWTPTNPSNTEPRAIWGDPNSNTRTSTRFLEDGSFWRLKNVVVGFKLPASIAEKARARSARVYIQGQNVFTKTKYLGFDPEVNYSGNTSITRGQDFYTLPQARTWTFGFNVGY